jgi:hypothetical protein
MPSPPPPDCRDPRLWLEADELADQHASRGGLCAACGTTAPCRIAEAAEDAKRRAMPPPSAATLELQPAPPPAPQAATPLVGARFPRAKDQPDTDELTQPIPAPGASVAPPEDAPTPVGARFPRESRAGRRRRRG